LRLLDSWKEACSACGNFKEGNYLMSTARTPERTSYFTA